MSTAWTRYLAQRAVVERAGRVAGLLEVAFDEGAGVHDQHAAVDQILQVGLERGRVHRHQHVGRVARRVDLARREVELEPRDPEQRASGSADLGREVGEGRDVVAGLGRGLGELGAGELHAVARIAGEADDDAVELLGLGHDFLGREAPRPYRCKGGCAMPTPSACRSCDNPVCVTAYAPVAQLDRALASGAKGQRFESSRVR
jgi:hypothetical protein